ncbi:unnamed protein product, partial [Didymodactylos carnosus]
MEGSENELAPFKVR